ncbi:MAG: aminotransferase class V-fold PLP-dependent enzyme [Bacteroidota bacterium]
MNIQERMFQDQKNKKAFEDALNNGFQYMQEIEHFPVFPSEESRGLLEKFNVDFPESPSDMETIISEMNEIGKHGTIAQIGGKYFGFVNGGAVPASVALQIMTDFWDQCGGLYLTSPIHSKLEEVCEQWLKDLFGLPEETVAGFVTGTSLANLSALCAARYRLLKNMGWDVFEQGLNGAPRIKVIAHEAVHSSVFKSLSILGFGKSDLIPVKADEHGRMDINDLPELDQSCLVLVQAGNVNTGHFDPFDEICDRANKVGAWVHVDGAFGLWAAACSSTKHFMKGFEKADSWAVDGHKTLNTPYENGIVLCKDKDALVASLEANADYIVKVKDRDPILYGPEMSKRSRAFEVWATMKYLGKQGIDEMVQNFCDRAKQFGNGLSQHGFRVLNKIVFNQVLIACATEEITKEVLKLIQDSGKMWCGSSKWNDEFVIRLSICSWATTKKDIEDCVQVMSEAKEKATSILAI